MPEPIRFFVPGDPKGQPRPRAFSRNGHARVYDPGTAEGWKNQIAIAARPHLPQEPLSCPIAIQMAFEFERPKSHFGTGRNAGRLKDGAPEHHVGKPDCDNLAKAVLDALTTLRFWDDDCAVVELEVRKRWASPPGCKIVIDIIEPWSSRENVPFGKIIDAESNRKPNGVAQ